MVKKFQAEVCNATEGDVPTFLIISARRVDLATSFDMARSTRPTLSSTRFRRI